MGKRETIMKGFALTMRRMKVKKNDAVKSSNSLDNWGAEVLPTTVEEFELFLDNIEASKEVKSFAKNIEWEIMISLFNIQFYELISRFELVNHSEIHWNNLGGYRHVVFESVKIEIFYHVYFWIKNDYKKVKSIDEFKDQLYDFFLIKMNMLVRPLDYQYSLTSVKYSDDPKILIGELEELNANAKQGKKFSGKSHRPHEVPVYEKVIKRYKELLTEGVPVSFSSLAMSFARKELGLINGNEAKNFANRCKRYMNNKK